ncbi:MAG: nucleotidyl transferase AbiEii/AbiGii toxin family protein [Candidatus Heimdallarchaeota archaeon]
MSDLDDLLIHGSKAFSEEELSRRAEKYGFSQPQILELFAWDYELTTQLQELSNELVLKGGAVAQLYLPPELQRGSVDIDIITPLGEDDLNQRIKKLSRKIRRSISPFQIKRYSPKTPQVNIPLSTYHVILPSVFQESCSIKIDVLTSQLGFPTMVLRGVETFALQVSKVKTLSLGTLIGDKLLTLARETIGMEREEHYPRQIYDIEMLTFKRGDLTQIEIRHMAEAIEKLVVEEA